MTADFRDMLAMLLDEDVEFLVVGAHAMASHGAPRATGDIDLWVNPTARNAERVWRVLKRFRAPMLNLEPDDLNKMDVVFQIGVPPNRIDLLTSIAGVGFDEAWGERVEVEVLGRVVPVIGRAHLLANKRAAGRPKDLADAVRLEADDATDGEA